MALLLVVLQYSYFLRQQPPNIYILHVCFRVDSSLDVSKMSRFFFFRLSSKTHNNKQKKSLNNSHQPEAFTIKATQEAAVSILLFCRFFFFNAPRICLKEHQAQSRTSDLSLSHQYKLSGLIIMMMRGILLHVFLHPEPKVGILHTYLKTLLMQYSERPIQFRYRYRPIYRYRQIYRYSRYGKTLSVSVIGIGR